MSSDLMRPNDPQGATHWAVHALSDDDAILDQLDQSIPVRLIATLGALTSVFADEPVADAERRGTEHRFDFLPVRSRSGGSIVGLFRRDDDRRANSGMVRDVMQPLDGATNLISADAPLSDFVTTADTSPCRLVLDRAEIRGLVTLSDLQRLHVRTFLFGLFIHLELLLTEELRRLVGDGTKPFELLPTKNAKGARWRWAKTVGSEMDRDSYSALMFSDKILIARDQHILGKVDSEIERELTDVEQLIRHPIAHGKSFALTPADVNTMVRTTRVMRAWIEELRRSNRGCHDPRIRPTLQRLAAQKPHLLDKPLFSRVRLTEVAVQIPHRAYYPTPLGHENSDGIGKKSQKRFVAKFHRRYGSIPSIAESPAYSARCRIAPALGP